MRTLALLTGLVLVVIPEPTTTATGLLVIVTTLGLSKK